jgi:hypothetical protein
MATGRERVGLLVPARNLRAGSLCTWSRPWESNPSHPSLPPATETLLLLEAPLVRRSLAGLPFANKPLVLARQNSLGKNLSPRISNLRTASRHLPKSRPLTTRRTHRRRLTDDPSRLQPLTSMSNLISPLCLSMPTSDKPESHLPNARHSQLRVKTRLTDGLLHHPPRCRSSKPPRPQLVHPPQRRSARRGRCSSGSTIEPTPGSTASEGEDPAKCTACLLRAARCWP